MSRKLAVMLLPLALAACDRPSERAPQERDRALQRAVEAPQDRARAVEADVLDAARRTEEAVEDQSD